MAAKVKYYLAFGELYDRPLIILIGRPNESTENIRERALQCIYEMGADDDTKDELRKTLKIWPRSSFIISCVDR